MNYALALHTTSSQLGLALRGFDGQHHQLVLELGRSLSTHLHSHLHTFIQPYGWKNVAWIAVAQGPGSFTSTRIGVVTARTLAQQLQIPLFGISTLAAYAWFQRSQSRRSAQPIEPDLAVVMPAQRNEVFAAIYTVGYDKQTETAPTPVLKDMTALLPDTVMTGDRWDEVLNTWSRPYQRMVVGEDIGQSVVSLLDLAHLRWQRGDRPHWATVLPFYGQSCVT